VRKSEKKDMRHSEKTICRKPSIFCQTLPDCYKICTIGAQIRKEGHEALGKNYLQKAIDLLPNPSRSGNILVLRFQFWYQGLGGRGFWRLARKLL